MNEPASRAIRNPDEGNQQLLRALRRTSCPLHRDVRPLPSLRSPAGPRASTVAQLLPREQETARAPSVTSAMTMNDPVSRLRIFMAPRGWREPPAIFRVRKRLEPPSSPWHQKRSRRLASGSVKGESRVTRRGWWLFLALSVIWGIPYLLIRVAVGELTPASLVFLRTAIASLLLLPALLRNGRLRMLLPRWRAILLFSLVEVALPWWLLSDAERRITSSLSGLLVASVPLAGALLSRLTGTHEPLGARRLMGLGLGFAGVVALVGLDLGGDAAASLEMTLVVFCYALGPQIVSRHLADLPSLDVVAVSLCACALVYAPIGIAQLPSLRPSAAVLAAVAVLGVFCTAVAFLLFVRLIAEVGPVRATVITYVNPAVAVLAGVVVLAEPFTRGTALGFVLILAGSWLATGAGSTAAQPRDRAAPRRTGPPGPLAGVAQQRSTAR